jgi:DNA-binding MarR family transcriptional regulator
MPAQTPTDNEIAHEMLRSIRQIVKRISEHSRNLSRDVGLTVPQLMCLKTIGELEAEEPEITVMMVGSRVGLSPATVSRIVDRLVRSGLVLRERRAKDRRKVCLSLTPAGFERFQALPTPLQERFVEQLMRLEERERTDLLSSLQRICELMDASDLDAAAMLAPGEHVGPSSPES